MNRVFVALGAVAGLVLVAAAGLFALGKSVGVGPFAPGAAASWLYVAISRGGEDGDARDIEIIDFATGERQVLALDDRAFDIALSPDRRTLYVGSTNGRIMLLDAVRGTPLGGLKLATTGEVRRLLPLPDGQRLIAITTVVLDVSATLVDLTTGKEKGTIPMGNRLVGRAGMAGAEPLLSVAERGSAELIVTLSLDPFRVREETQISASPFRGVPRTAAAAMLVASDGSIVALSPFSLRLVVLAPGFTDRRSADVPRGGGGSVGPIVPGFDGDLAISTDRAVIHFCLGTGQRADRFRADWDTLTMTRVGGDCGRYARLADGSLYLAVRGKPQLDVLDPATGAVIRSLALAGYPQRLAF